jgi:hypothetical protein
MGRTETEMDRAAAAVPPPAVADDDALAGSPSPEALIAGTLALMTAWADPCPQARLPPGPLRQLLARKVVAQLFLLQHHPQVAPKLRQSVAQARLHWLGLAREAPAPPADPAPPAPAKAFVH